MRNALIIGGGIAGPAAAMALQRAGIDATVYEGHAEGAEGIGTFLTVATNGLDALRTLDADKRVLAAGFATPSLAIYSGTGKRLGAVDLGGMSGQGTQSHTIKRADLYQAVHEEALGKGIRTEYGKRLVDAKPAGQGVRAVFADGSEVTGDLLIGCDGIHSKVRRLIDPAAPGPSYTGLVGLGGHVRGVVDGDPGTYHMVFGKRGFFGYVIANDGEAWWFANVPRRDEPARGELAAISTEQWRERLVRLFADDAGPAARIVAATEHELVASAMHTIPHLRKWHDDRLIVIGDAAHAPSPSSGQGASLSIEDAVVLAQCLRDLPQPAAAFARFDALRRSRVERIIKQAARTNSRKAAGPIARVFRDLMLPTVLKMTANSRQQREIHDFHIEWDAPAAS